jgi:transposase InsO family protein
MHNGRREPRRMRYSLESRLRIVRLIEAGETPANAAAALGASRASGYRLWRRYQAEGWPGLADRRSTPKRQPRKLSAAEEAQIVALRRELGAGPQVLAVILGRPASTIGKVLRRAGCSRLPQPEQPIRPRYERERPGELLHVDVKKLARFWKVGKRITGDGAGYQRSRGARWSYLHVAIDDHTRLAYAELLPDERGPSCAAFLRRAHAWYAERGITLERVLSDNAKAYHGQYWLAVCSELGINRRYTRPYSPWTNGKAEALIKTMLREWARRHAYPTSSHRARALSGYLRWYNNHRPHGSLGARPPISRVSHVCNYST